MNSAEKLKEMLMQFPSVGPRQAERFIYFILSRSKAWKKEFANLIEQVQQEVELCPACFRFYQKNHKNNSGICSICANNQRDNALMVVLNNTDLKNIEKSGSYTGKYFVIGGLAPSVGKAGTFRMQELIAILKKTEFTEIILAMPATVDGDYTTEYIKHEIIKTLPEYKDKISVLGRGLSRGVELEYADPATIKEAIKNKKTIF